MRYLIRSVKYFVMLLAVLFLIMCFVNTSGEIQLTLAEKLSLFFAENGVTKIIFFGLVSLVYPLFGFVKRDVEGSVEANEGQIIVAMESAGFTLKSKGEGKMLFGANTILRRVTFLFEDKIAVEQRGDKIHIEGVRRGVVYAAYCLDGFIKNSSREE